MSASAPSRTRLEVAAGAALAVLVAVALAIVLTSGSSVQPPATGAAALVPGDALAYVHLSTDPRRPADKRALALATRFPDFPLLAAAVRSRVAAIAGGGGANVDFAGAIRPWLGKEAALALLNTSTTTAASLVILDVADRGRAHSLLVGRGALSDGTYGGVPLLSYRTGTELAFVRHYLVLGERTSVEEAIDASAGRSQSLAASQGYQRAAAGEPQDRAIDAYASAAGIRRVLSAHSGLLGGLGALVDEPSLLGTTISVSPAAGGARVRVHSALDPSLARLAGSGKSSFSPTLQSAIPSGSTLMLDVTGLAHIAPRVLSAAATSGVAGQIGPLLSRLGTALSSEGVNVADILSIFGGETAVALVPSSSAPSRSPTLIIVTRTRNEDQTRTELAALEAPLAQLFPAPASGPGAAPEFNDRQVGGISAHQLVLAPGLEVDYAVFDGLVVVSTSLNGIATVAEHQHSLAAEPQYRVADGSRPARLTSLLFLDFSQLLSLGEQTGLTRSAQYRAIRADLERIRSIGLASTSGEADSTAELFLQIP